MRSWVTAFLILNTGLLSGQTTYQKDFNQFWNVINENYAYLDQQKINWEKVKQIYEPGIAAINTKEEFVRLLELVLNELYNGHSSLNTNLRSSNKLVPSGQDLFVEIINHKFIITDIRKGSGAEQCGLTTGMEIILFNGKPVEEQLKKFLPKFTTDPIAKMVRYAIDMLFAGTHDKKREITITEKGTDKLYFPDSYEPLPYISLAESKMVNISTAYIKINNSLGNNELITAFDSLLDKYINYKNLVIDLTETPAGGNTTVARSILGRFINKILPYQTHEFDEKQFQTKRIWTEYVMPRKKQYKGNVYILVGHWTGSMGEGMAIGFDGMKRATTIGTSMAGLLGAISNFQLTETKISFQFPTERLYHVDGRPREQYLPVIRTKNTEETYKKMKALK